MKLTVRRPDDADGFRVSIACDDGWCYRLLLRATLTAVRDESITESDPVEFEIISPIVSVETLRARRGV